MTEMLERVERAIREIIYDGTDPEGGPMNDPSEECARAAIKALMEPTEEMKIAGREKLRELGLMPAFTDEGKQGMPVLQFMLGPTFEAMLRAALNGGTNDIKRTNEDGIG